jgi:DNA-binding IclR family transcriptional regulator
MYAVVESSCPFVAVVRVRDSTLFTEIPRYCTPEPATTFTAKLLYLDSVCCDMTQQRTGVNGVQSVETLLEILDEIRELNGARVTEIADHLDLAKSTVHRHLSTLQEYDYVIQEGEEYHMGLRFLTLGEYARRRNPVYRQAAPLVEKLAQETEERSLLMVEEHGKAIYLHRGVGNRAVRTNSNVGTRRHLHTIAGGKAILAHLPEERVHEILDRWGLPQVTKHTITDREEFFDELERVRERGIAFNREEAIEGLNAVASPVLTRDDTVVGSLSVSGPAHRVKGEWFEEEIPDLLLGTANELMLNMTHSE